LLADCVAKARIRLRLFERRSTWRSEPPGWLWKRFNSGHNIIFQAFPRRLPANKLPILLLFCLLASGCAGSSSRPEIDNNRPEQAYLIPAVPFFPQKELLCGPASLQSVFAFLGTDVPQDEIARDIFVPKIKGTLHFDLVLYARKKGFTTLTPEGSLDEMIRQIRSNRPVIAFLNQGTSLFPLGHYIVIFGYDQRNEALVAHSGTDEFEQIKYSKFLRQWETTGRWMLVILPP